MTKKQGKAVLQDARFQASITSTVHRVDQIIIMLGVVYSKFFHFIGIINFSSNFSVV